MHFSPTSIRLFLVVSANVVALVAFLPDDEQLKQLTHPRATAAADGADALIAQLASVALWLLAAWIAISLVATLVGALPGVVGRAGLAVAAIMTPAILQRAIAGAAGFTVLVGPVATAVSAHAQPPVPITLPAPVLPISDDVPLPTAHAPHTVIVQPGDSLWTIAEGELGRAASPARVARLWPRWFEANRSVIGDDPSFLQPGERLSAPDGDQR